MDISSDLTELGKTPVAVISAGVKSILDIARTLEYLVLSFAYSSFLINFTVGASPKVFR
jgi:pseudouridine-5'-phosphate glycosidase